MADRHLRALVSGEIVRGGRDAFVATLAPTGAALLRIEFGIAPVDPDGRLTRTGLIVANAPFTLADEMRIVSPAPGGRAWPARRSRQWGVDAMGAPNMTWLAEEGVLTIVRPFPEGWPSG